MGAAAAHNGRAQGARRSFSARARRAAFLHAHGHSRKETAAIVGVRPETISVWKRHPQWQLELQRWRKLAEAPLDKTQQRLQLEAAEATVEALRPAAADHGARHQGRAHAHRHPGRARLADTVEGLSARADDRLRGNPGASRRRAPGAARPPHASHRALIRTSPQQPSRRADRWPC
jgi:hypothetical protein